MTRYEELLEALLNGETTDIVPLSRSEAILKNCIDGKGIEDLCPPMSRNEAYLQAVCEKMLEGGGGSSGGTDMTAMFVSAMNGDCVDLAIPEGVTKIRDYAFQKLSTLKTVSLPSTLTYIGQYAFYDCTGLTAFEFPEGFTTLRSASLAGCKNIRELVFPASLATLEGAFGGCFNLRKVTFKGKPTTMSTSAFYNCAQLYTINVPWAEGEVAGAPWGASTATVNYNYTGE